MAGKLPKAYLHHLEVILDTEPGQANLLRLSRIVPTKAFFDHTEINDYRRIFTKYCKAYFTMLFDENSSYANAVNELWIFLKEQYETPIVHWERNLSRAGNPAIAQLMQFSKQIMTNQNRGVIGEKFLNLFFMDVVSAVDGHVGNPSIPLSTHKTNLKRHNQIVAERYDALFKIQVYEHSTDDMPHETMLCVITAILDLQITQPALMALRNAISSPSYSASTLKKITTLSPSSKNLFLWIKTDWE